MSEISRSEQIDHLHKESRERLQFRNDDEGSLRVSSTDICVSLLGEEAEAVEIGRLGGTIFGIPG